MRWPGGRSGWLVAALLGVVLVGVAIPAIAHRRGGEKAPGVARYTARPAWRFSASGLDGGGFQNVVAFDPMDPAVVLSGADVSGLARSTDGGRTWVRVNAGLAATPGGQSVAALVFSPHRRDEVYAATGLQGVGGGVYASLDGGVSWRLRSAVPQFSGGNNLMAGSGKHPRPTGQLLVVDPRSGALLAGTFQQGLMRSTDGGRSWRSLGLTGMSIRSVAVGADGVGYVGTAGRGVFAVRQPFGAASVTPLPGSPRTVEELRVFAGKLYGAAGTGGIVLSADGGATWSPLGGGTVPVGPIWESLAVTGTPQAPVIYAGSAGAVGGKAPIVRSADGGRRFSVLTRKAAFSDAVGGAGGPRWWLATRKAVMPGGAQYVAADIAVSPLDSRRLLIAGRSGVWGSEDGGAQWSPLVRGLGVTINSAIVTDPGDPNRVYVATTDWVLFTSTDGMRTVRQTRPPGGGVGYALALDPAAQSNGVSRLYVGTAGKGNTGGEVWATDDATTDRFSAQGLNSATGGKAPLGLVAGRAGNETVLVAAVRRSGIWRRSAGRWALVEPAAMRAAVRPVSMAWVGPNVYLYDPGAGLWRSTDEAKHWSLLWPHRAPLTESSSLAVDPRDPDRGYVAGDRLWQLDGLTGSPRARMLAAPSAGAITLAPDGTLYTATGGGVEQPRLLRVEGAALADVSDTRYRAEAVRPNAITIGRDGKVYVALRGTGVLVGQ